MSHNFYWVCKCGSHASDAIPSCPACKGSKPDFDSRCAERWTALDRAKKWSEAQTHVAGCTCSNVSAADKLKGALPMPTFTVQYGKKDPR